MGYESFPFTAVFAGDRRRFCGHAEVAAYLAAFAEHYGLRPLVRFNTEVLSARPIEPRPGRRGQRERGGQHERGVSGGEEEGGGGGGGGSGGIEEEENGVTTAAADEDDDAEDEEEDARRWGPKWRVVSATTSSGDHSVEEVYDAVVVCNGHYSEPRVPHFPGGSWPGTLQMHSHNYRDPAMFTGKNVVAGPYTSLIFSLSSA